MDYNTFRPAGGYTRAVKPAPAPAVAPVGEPLAYLDGREGDFRELRVTEGVGPFHVNHFIGYSTYRILSDPDAIMAPYSARFYNEFDALFEPNVASATTRKYSYKGAKTIEFELGDGKGDTFVQILSRLLHSDWVSFQKSTDGVSFYASTLRRGWLVNSEKAALIGSRALQSKVARAVGEQIKVNQHHFLAGRRSFRFGYDQQLKRVYVETAALERSSLCDYRIVEKTGLLRDSIIEIWSNLLANVQKRFALQWIAPPYLLQSQQAVRAGYTTNGNVDYRTAEFETASAAVTDNWFAAVLSRHPGLVKGLSI